RVVEGKALDLDAFCMATGFCDEPAEPARPPARTSPRVAAPSVGHAGHGYVDTAVERACENVRTAPEGMRNTTLNREAYSVAGLAAKGLIDEVDTRARLLKASLESGLSEAEALKTIASGWSAGHRAPREVPDPGAARHPVAPRNDADAGP